MLQPPCEVLLLQEHKLSGIKASDLGKRIWPDAECFILDAESGYTHNPDGARRGGVGIMVSPYLKYMVVSSGAICNNKALWITLKGTPVGKLGILGNMVDYGKTSCHLLTLLIPG